MQPVQDSRRQVLSAVEAAARRREDARSELRRRLTAVGQEHAQCVARMMATYEAEAQAEEAFFRRRTRRAKFQREEMEAYLSLAAGAGTYHRQGGRGRTMRGGCEQRRVHPTPAHRAGGLEGGNGSDVGDSNHDNDSDGESDINVDGGSGREEHGGSEDGFGDGSGSSGGHAVVMGASGVYELIDGGVEMQQVRQELSVAAGAAGELPPRAVAAAAAAIAAAAAADRKAQAAGGGGGSGEGWQGFDPADASSMNRPIGTAGFEEATPVSTGMVLSLGAYRIVAAAAASAFKREVEAAIDLGARGGMRRALKWAFLSVAPTAVRAILMKGLEAAAAGGELGGAVCGTFTGTSPTDFRGDDGGGGCGDPRAVASGAGVACSVRLYRSAGGAYDAVQLAAAAAAAAAATAAASVSYLHPDDDQDSAAAVDDFHGPASIIMCQVLANPATAAAWERVAPRRKPTPAATTTAAASADPVLSALFPTVDVCPQYVLHLERAPHPPSMGGGAAAGAGGAGRGTASCGFHPAEAAGGNLSIQAHVMDRLEAPTVRQCGVTQAGEPSNESNLLY